MTAIPNSAGPPMSTVLFGSIDIKDNLGGVCSLAVFTWERSFCFLAGFFSVESPKVRSKILVYGDVVRYGRK